MNFNKRFFRYIVNLDLTEFELKLFDIYFQEKVNRKYFFNIDTIHSFILINFGFLFFCINNDLKETEKKVYKIFKSNYPEIPYKKALNDLYLKFHNRDTDYEVLSNFFDYFNFDSSFLSYYIDPEYQTYEKNDVVICSDEFLNDILPSEYKQFIFDSNLPVGISTHLQKIKSIEDTQMNEVLEWTKSAIEKIISDKSKYANKEKVKNVFNKINNELGYIVEGQDEILPF